MSTFLNNLFNDNLFKDSSIFILSDHGVTMPSIYYLYDFYQIEGQLPMLYIIVNERNNTYYQKQFKYMQENQQNLITAFDIYNTLGNIIYGDKYKNIKNKTSKKDTFKSPKGISLFDKINGKKRIPIKYSDIYKIDLNVCKL